MLNILTMGDPILKKTSAMIPDINGVISELAAQMFQTMEQARGLGLAAVQVGELIRMFITLVPRDKPRVFINPDILETSIEQVPYEEGCLSIPGINADVERPASIRVQAWNEKGRPFSLEADALLARVIQHEYDHLNGVLFVDRLGAKKRGRLITEFQEQLRL
jgi:peptide deformylase